MATEKTLKDIIDSLLPDKAIPALFKQTLCAEIKLYVELRCDEHTRECLKQYENLNHAGVVDKSEDIERYFNWEHRPKIKID